MRSTGMTFAQERAVEPLGVASPAHEDQRRAELLVEERQNARLLVVRIDEVEPVRDARNYASRRHDVDAQRILEEALRQAFDRRRHGGREHHRVAHLGQRLQDGVDLRHETHVEHVVGFVDHQLLDFVEPHGAALEMVEQPPGSGHDDAGLLGQLVHLMPDVQAADERHGAQPVAGPEVVEKGLGLQRDLARRREDEPAGAAPGRDALGERDRECGGLAGAGLGEAENVASGDRLGDDRGLDRCRMGPAQLGDGEPQLGRHTQVIEGAGGLGNGMLRKGGFLHSGTFYAPSAKSSDWGVAPSSSRKFESPTPASR